MTALTAIMEKDKAEGLVPMAIIVPALLDAQTHKERLDELEIPLSFPSNTQHDSKVRDLRTDCEDAHCVSSDMTSSFE